MRGKILLKYNRKVYFNRISKEEARRMGIRPGGLDQKGIQLGLRRMNMRIKSNIDAIPGASYTSRHAPMVNVRYSLDP